MGNLANISGKDAIKAFGKAGWMKDRQKGSHIVLVKAGVRHHLSVPDHKELGPGLLRKLIEDAGISVEDFLALL